MKKQEFIRAATIMKCSFGYTDEELAMLINLADCLAEFFSILEETILTRHFRREFDVLESYRLARIRNGHWTAK